MASDNVLDAIANLATEALISEAMLAPKPGLVDEFDNGSHNDMDIDLFICSARSLKDGFYSYLDCGHNHQGELSLLMKKIRPIGITAESEMFGATNGVNTHKGANFTFGIILAATGYYLKEKPISDFSNISEIFSIVKQMAKGVVSADFAGINQKKNLTYGEKLYLNYGITGIRGEAEAGYPNITKVAMPKLIELNAKKTSKYKAYLEVLFVLMSVVDDSNIIARGGIESLEYVKKTASEFLSCGGVMQDGYIEKIQAINTAFKQRNLSPGGSADLLSAVIFLDRL